MDTSEDKFEAILEAIKVGLFFLSLLWLAIGTYQRFTQPTCAFFGEIAQVGGCDFVGHCSVLSTEGVKGAAPKPVVGERTCIQQISLGDWFFLWKRVPSEEAKAEKAPDSR